jgi:RNA polymerase sigma-70 factor, ECF subfamily
MPDPLELPDWIRDVRRGRTEAFAHVVRAYALTLRSYLASQVYHLDDVDDLAQDVFLAALEGLSGFRLGDDFGAWLRGIARNKLLMYYRSESRRAQAMQRFRAEVAAITGEDLDLASAADRADAIQRLLGCVASLPDRLRKVVRGGLNGDRAAVLARELSTTVGVIYNLHCRATQLLRDCMTKGGA